MDEVNVESVDLGQELRQGVEFRFDLAPVIFARPIAGERLSCCDWSDTVSRSGQRVALIRRRNSESSESGKLARNGRIALLSELACCPTSSVAMIILPS
jgi:hypothetical protein